MTMLVVNISGGLGNQMFQYAFARAHQIQGKKVYLDLREYKNNTFRHYGLDIFKITVPELPELYYRLFYDDHVLWRLLRKLNFLTFETLQEKGLSYTASYLDVERRTRFFGYFQSHKYFKQCATFILNDFQFKDNLTSKNSAYGNRIIKEESVAIHVRRGDFASNPVANKIHGV